jgi:hypothetical protein
MAFLRLQAHVICSKNYKFLAVVCQKILAASDRNNLKIDRINVISYDEP